MNIGGRGKSYHSGGVTLKGDEFRKIPMETSILEYRSSFSYEITAASVLHCPVIDSVVAGR